MHKVTLLVATWCPQCPAAKKLWNELKHQYDFQYEEVDIGSEEGAKLVKEFEIMGVPTTIVDGNVAFAGGAPSRAEAIKLMSN